MMHKSIIPVISRSSFKSRPARALTVYTIAESARAQAEFGVLVSALTAKQHEDALATSYATKVLGASFATDVYARTIPDLVPEYVGT